ncbi:MAG: hypothetical protein EAZ80_09950 [Runella slithyformis]|jgi:O-glycosyl hydrolase|nr:MAG: hypothetical protein EAZ80_09950 [Runella slithyformis]
MKKISPYLALLLALIVFSCQTGGESNKNTKTIQKYAVVDAAKTLQVMDGFGTNVNPDQWRDGNLKKAIDLLIDELGSSVIRLDCYGNSAWLDPAKMNANGKWSDEYLKEVYTSKRFTNAWETFRYFNAKGVKVFMNVSGIVPDAWNYKGTKELQNYDAYAEMQATMVHWARHKEKLQFEFYAPFNETDFDGSVEGPGISPKNKPAAFEAILNKFQEHGLNDLKYILFCDGNFAPERMRYFLADKKFTPQTFAISGHTYGNGDEGDADGWITENSLIGRVVDSVRASAYKDKHIWLTEYGDLDQTDEIEWEFAWRCQRRLFRAIREGVNLAQTWDAWDNFHFHDQVWSKYGMIKTDTTNWTYTPKHRFYTTKHIYKYVRPGWKRIEIGLPANKITKHVYQWHAGHLKNIKLLAFISPDGKDFTITGMNLVEADVELHLDMKGLVGEITKSIGNYRSTRNENFVETETVKLVDNKLKVQIKEKSIFTITTLK